MPFSYPQNTGAFIPQSNIWNVSEIYAADLDPKLTELFVRMYQNLGLMATNVNYKDTGYYPLQPFINGQLFFPNPANNSSTPAYAAFRQDFRLVINFGALPDATTKSIPHGINMTPTFSATRIYGASTNPTTLEQVPLPYASTTGDNIELWIDDTYVNVRTNSATWIGYTITYIIYEYLQS